MASLPEQAAYKVFAKGCVGRLNAKRIENQVGDGMSDFVVQSENGFNIWLEVKALSELPVRDTTCPLKGTFRPGQLPFLKEQISWGGHGFVLLRVGTLWWLFDPTHADLEAIQKSKLTASSYSFGLLADIIKALEDLRHEDCPYEAPNYRPGTKRRKA